MATMTHPGLERSDGYYVEAGNADVGLVEEVWLGDDAAVHALAIRTVTGEHGLLLAEDVAAVDPDQERVAMREGALLLALEPPRLLAEPDGSTQLHASWATSGKRLPLPEPHAPGTLSEYIPRPHLPQRAATAPRSELRAFAVSIGTLYAFLAFLAGALIGLDFLVAWLVTGSPAY
jgi:hypothetical protein